MKDLIWNNLLRLLRDKVGYKGRETARYLSSYTLKMNNLLELLLPLVIASMKYRLNETLPRKHDYDFIKL